jgi:membrane associated rhomboid family serine protease
MQLLSEEQDTQLLLAAAFIPARYADGLLAGGLLGFTSPITYSFLHGDVTHLAVNSIWLLAMGSAVAKRIGSLRFLVFSLICGLFAALAHVAMHFGEALPVIGASGAISGHMAAAIRFVFSAEGSHGAGMMRRDVRAIPLKPLASVLADTRVIAVLLVWLATNVLTGTGIMPLGEEGTSIAWEAHIGGFLAGLLLFSPFDHPDAGTAVQATAADGPPTSVPQVPPRDGDQSGRSS